MAQTSLLFKRVQPHIEILHERNYGYSVKTYNPSAARIKNYNSRGIVLVEAMINTSLGARPRTAGIIRTLVKWVTNTGILGDFSHK